jgi:ATP-binding cassette subfamily C protein
MQRNVQSLAFMIPAFRTAMTMEAECLAAAEPAPEQDGFNPSLRTAVELRNVGFSYAERGPQKALCDINLIIPARTTTALVGSTGAGKSTLADVLVGLLTPNEGQILVDGEPLTPQRSRRWRGVVAYVPQETFLFHDTIRSNLLWSRPEATAEEIYDALRMAAADSFVSGLPQGLDTIVGERGIRLSGGERQRLALARALLRRPSLLVLDEATSALDSEHELRIQQAIEELHGELTIVIIAHRLSTVRHADHIVVLEGGRVVESGNWDDLGADVRGRFHALLEAAGTELS